MTTLMIREFQPGDAPVLWAIFHAAVHGLCAPDYSEAQRLAWAPPVPESADAEAWSTRVARNRPYVAEIAGIGPVGYADLQASGEIDHFFVHPAHARHGVGQALMCHIVNAARQRGIDALFASVSLTAEPFFFASGFKLVQRQEVVVRGVAMPNARMARQV
ncbi:GNAT family N-acetyltransferase [Cupriavidus sp. RAF12]|uniref:GNAT family N-acetyltransferase n=1 Tax=Cupriavidus sp. RAF12 TaxID=3233050 RepID=UPI003F92F448